MDISESIEVLVLVQQSLFLLDLTDSAIVLLDNALLEVGVNLLQCLVFTELICNSSDQFFSHFSLFR
jgi:hypothetical protein